MSKLPNAELLKAVQAPPADLASAQAEMDVLQAEIVSIQHQLGDDNRTNDFGARLTHAAWAAWRRKALAALRFKIARYRVLKDWVKEQHVAASVAQQETRTAREGQALLLAEQAIVLLEEAGLTATATPLRARLEALVTERQAAYRAADDQP